jgi:hypothetical protein
MSAEKKVIAAGDVTKEVIEGWKKEHGNVFAYEAKDGKKAYFKKPDFKIMDAASALAQTQPLMSNKILADNCFLGGDRCIVDEQDYFAGLNAHLSRLIKKIEGELTEL